MSKRLKNRQKPKNNNRITAEAIIKNNLAVAIIQLHQLKKETARLEAKRDNHVEMVKDEKSNLKMLGEGKKKVVAICESIVEAQKLFDNCPSDIKKVLNDALDYSLKYPDRVLSLNQVIEVPDNLTVTDSFLNQSQPVEMEVSFSPRLITKI